MKTLYFLLLLNLVIQSCSVRLEQDYEDYYNLSMSKERFMDRLLWVLRLKGDTVAYKPYYLVDKEINKEVFSFIENKVENQRIPLDVGMYQQFPLYHTFKTVDISVKIKEENLQEAWLKTYLLGIDEKFIYRDSVRIDGVGWKTYKLKMPLHNAYYLGIAFSAKGKPCEIHSGAKILVDGFDIRLDGNSINSANTPVVNSEPILDSILIQGLSFTDDSLVGAIPLFEKRPRIIGLGETMHGSLSLGKVKNQIIRWLVENRDCKLVMVEAPSLMVLKWDLYTQGYSVDLSEILEELAGTSIVREEIVKLLNFLREYNYNTDKKVHIAGIDRSVGITQMPMIHDYFYGMYKQKPRSDIYRLIKSQFVVDSVLHVLMNPKLSESIGDFEYNWFGQLYWLKLMEHNIPGVKENGALDYRDYIMWRHAYYALKAAALKENECAVVTGHCGHLNKWDVVSSPQHSLGYYLAESYGEDYCSIGLLAGEGKVCIYRGMQQKFDSDCLLSPPEEGSLEKSALKSGLSYFYYPTDSLPASPISIRDVPFAYERQVFSALNVRNRIDGFIFVRESESVDLPAGQRDNDSYKKVFVKRLERVFKRNKELNIVWERK